MKRVSYKTLTEAKKEIRRLLLEDKQINKKYYLFDVQQYFDEHCSINDNRLYFTFNGKRSLSMGIEFINTLSQNQIVKLMRLWYEI